MSVRKFLMAMLRGLGLIAVSLYSWLALRSFWFDLTAPPNLDATLSMSLIVFVLWPASLLVTWDVVRTVRAKLSSDDVSSLAVVRASIGAVGLLSISLHFVVFVVLDG